MGWTNETMFEDDGGPVVFSTCPKCGKEHSGRSSVCSACWTARQNSPESLEMEAKAAAEKDAFEALTPCQEEDQRTVFDPYDEEGQGWTVTIHKLVMTSYDLGQPVPRLAADGSGIVLGPGCPTCKWSA